MKTNDLDYFEFSPELPDFKQLGRKHLSEVTAADFWSILIIILTTNARDRWRVISESFLAGNPVPEAFRNQDWDALSFWKAFAWENVSVGVLRHPPTGLCRTVCFSMVDEDVIVGPSLKSLSPKSAGQACLAHLTDICREIGSPIPDLFINYASRFITREDIKEALRLGWALIPRDLDAFFEKHYQERNA